eukprot:scaffold3640_cov237-Skeletonema_menzelii.AAC.1
MPASRKKAKGKARKAAKAEQQQQAAAAASSQRGALHSQFQPQPQHLGGNDLHMNNNTRVKKCQHGFGTEAFSGWRICDSFMGPFMDAFNASGRHDDQDLRAAMDATYDQFSEVWKDAAKLKWVISCFVANGTRYILDGTGEGGGDEYAIKDYAIIAYYLEEYVKVTLKKTQERMDWKRICELQVGNNPSEHQLVKFYHERNPCKCLEKLYREGEKVKALREKLGEKMTMDDSPPNMGNTQSEEEDTAQPTDQLGLNKEHYEKMFKRNEQGYEFFKAMGGVDVWGIAAGVSPSQPSLN